MPFNNRIEEFKQGRSRLAFACINDREAFANKLKDRAINAGLINQARTPLCGPAAFMHCIASKWPAEYVDYVLDLAEEGKGTLGKLIVEPRDDCLNASLGNAIDPVDWVALASLRDSTNRSKPMDRTDAEFAGITLGGALAGWFKKTDWFSACSNSSGPLSSRSFEHLLGINQRLNSHICLLIRSAIITTGTTFDIGYKKPHSGTPKTLTGFPDHWVVLKGRINIDHKPAPPPGILRGDDLNNLMHKQLDFRLWSWGENGSIRDRIHTITPAQFQPYYYGYVSATD